MIVKSVVILFKKRSRSHPGKAGTLRDESLALYQALKCRNHIDELERSFSEREDFNYKIGLFGPYQEAIKALDNIHLIKHYLHESMSKEIDSLKTKWNNAYHHHQLAKMKAKLDNDDMEGDDFLRLHNLGIECNEFDFVIESVAEYHKSNAPTMSSYNCIGVCHDFKKELSTAFEYFKLALDLMLSSKDYNHTIISNYLN